MVLNVLATDRAVDSIVALVNEDGAAQDFIVQSPGGGAVTLTPLSNTAWVDANSTAVGTPDGSIANPFLDVQDAINAGFQNVIVCPGTYGTLLLGGTLTGQPFSLLGLGPVNGSSGRVVLGNVNNLQATVVTLENCEAGQCDLSNAGVSTLQLIDVTLHGNVIGDGLGNSTLRFGTRLQDVGDGQQPNQFSGTLAMGELRGSYAQFAGDLVCVNVAFQFVHGVGISSTGECELMQNCRFDGDLSFSAGGDHVIRNSLVVGPLFIAGGGTQEIRDSQLNSGVDTGTGDWALHLFNTFADPVAVQCSCDSASEQLIYRGGSHFVDGTQNKVLDGVAGDFQPASASATVNVSGPTRVVLQPDLPAAQFVKFQATGSPLDNQGFYVDSWALNTCEAQDSSGGHLFTIPANAAGAGMRFLFQFDSGTGEFTGPTQFWKLAGPP